MRGDDRVDEVIDAALRTYAEPREMPDARVAVARVLAQVESAESRKRFWTWAAMVPAVTCLLMVILVSMWWMGRSRVQEIAWVPKAPGVMRAEKPGRIAVLELSHSGARKPAHQNGAPAVAVVWERLPKMDVFPSPRPLTAEERALVVFAAQASPETKKQVVEAEKHVGDPIVIAELKIAPLVSGAMQDSKEPEKDKEK
jgi:hypothetical protein